MKKETLTPHAQIDYKLLSHLSHEARCPFNGLLGFSDLLSSHFDSLSTDKQKEFAVLVHQLSQKSFFQLQFLVTWIRIISNNLTLNITSCSIDDVIKQSIDKLESDIVSKGITITTNSHKKANVSLDPLLFSVAITSVLNTCIKTLLTSKEIQIAVTTTSNTLKISISWQVEALTETINALVNQSASPDESYNEYNIQIWVAQQIAKLHNGNLTLTKITAESSYQLVVEFTLPLGL
jgi:K+-sensing histidine kinase KdpD